MIYYFKYSIYIRFNERSEKMKKRIVMYTSAIMLAGALVCSSASIAGAAENPAQEQTQLPKSYSSVDKETFSTKKFVEPEKLDERDFIETELDTYLSNFISTSIIEGVTDASWAAHLEQLKTVQYYEWLEWYQNYIDGTL